MQYDKILKKFRKLPEEEAIQLLLRNEDPFINEKMLQIIFARPWRKASWTILIEKFFLVDKNSISLKVPILMSVLSKNRFYYEMKKFKEKFPSHEGIINYYITTNKNNNYNIRGGDKR